MTRLFVYLTRFFSEWKGHFIQSEMNIVNFYFAMTHALFDIDHCYLGDIIMHQFGRFFSLRKLYHELIHKFLLAVQFSLHPRVPALHYYCYLISIRWFCFITVILLLENPGVWFYPNLNLWPFMYDIEFIIKYHFSYLYLISIHIKIQA